MREADVRSSTVQGAAAALERLGNDLMQAMEAFVELPSREHEVMLYRLMFRYQAIYELSEVP